MPKSHLGRYFPPVVDMTAQEDQTPQPDHVWFAPFHRVARHLDRVRSGNIQGPGTTGGEVSDQPNSRSQ